MDTQNFFSLPLSTPSSASSQIGSHGSASMFKASIPTLSASPGIPLLTPPRSLFSMTPTPRSPNTSLFSMPIPSSTAQSKTNNTPLGGSFSTPLELPNSPNGSSTSFVTPPTARTEPNTAPSAPSVPRTMPMAQRQQLVTPSPFKTPISSTSLPRLHTEVTQSPVSQIQNSVARILQFDESPERPRPKRLMERETDQPDSAMNPPDPKRALPPTTTESITTTATSNFFQALAMPPPKPTSVGSIQSPIAPSSPAVSIDYTSSPVMSPSPTNMSSANTLTASAYSTPPSSVHSSPSSSHTSPLHPPSEVGTPFSKSNVNSAPVDTPTPLQLHLANRVPHQTYSSYSAALAAQALLEENEVDTISPDQLREAFLSESSAMATALEDLVANVTDTSDLLHQLNLSLQMANNEVLLMNTSLMMDDRLHKLHQFFSGATA